MNSTINLLLRAALAAAASDREKFVDKVGSLIENKVGTSPETAEQVAGGIDQLVELLDKQLFYQQLAAGKTDTTELENKVDRLTEAIDKLNAKIEKLAQK